MLIYSSTAVVQRNVIKFLIRVPIIIDAMTETSNTYVIVLASKRAVSIAIWTATELYMYLINESAI